MWKGSWDQWAGIEAAAVEWMEAQLPKRKLGITDSIAKRFLEAATFLLQGSSWPTPNKHTGQFLMCCVAVSLGLLCFPLTVLFDSYFKSQFSNKF